MSERVSESVGHTPIRQVRGVRTKIYIYVYMRVCVYVYVRGSSTPLFAFM